LRPGIVVSDQHDGLARFGPFEPRDQVLYRSRPQYAAPTAVHRSRPLYRWCESLRGDLSQDVIAHYIMFQ